MTPLAWSILVETLDLFFVEHFINFIDISCIIQCVAYVLFLHVFLPLFAVPELIAPPEVSALSSTSLMVKWSSTEGHGLIARGQVTEYRVNLVTEQSNNPYAPPFITQVRHKTRQSRTAVNPYCSS